MKNRYTLQIVGTFDTDDKFQIQKDIYDALNSIEELTVKAVTVDLWCDQNGTVRVWDDEGKEITEGYLSIPVEPHSTEQIPATATEETVEDVQNISIEEVSEEK